MLFSHQRVQGALIKKNKLITTKTKPTCLGSLSRDSDSSMFDVGAGIPVHQSTINHLNSTPGHCSVHADLETIVLNEEGVNIYSSQV